jgi:hypothetical protein
MLVFSTLFPVWKSILVLRLYHTHRQCAGGWVWGSGPQADKHIPQSPLTDQFFRWRHFALPSLSLIFLPSVFLGEDYYIKNWFRATCSLEMFSEIWEIHQYPNSWTYNLLDVSGRNLESSQTWGYCVDFLNHREGVVFLFQFFPLSPLQCRVMHYWNWKRLCEFEEVKFQFIAVEVTLNGKKENS